MYDRLASLVRQHRTTLVFVNTRRLAERIARQLSERIGSEFVTAHHGSLAKERRFKAEQQLKRGELKALVATASLELGLDIGDVDLVCQIGSTHSINTFLQRVGRAGHAVGGTSKGRLFPLSRDELVECTALLDAVRRGELDILSVPRDALDVMAQQLTAEIASREWHEDALFDLVRGAYPYSRLRREDFDECIAMLASRLFKPSRATWRSHPLRLREPHAAPAQRRTLNLNHLRRSDSGQCRLQGNART